MKKKIIISWLLVIIWLGIIFFLSSMPSEVSNSNSEGTIETVIEKTVETSNKVGIIKEAPAKNKIKEISKELNKPLRKCMHASVYLILALLLINALRFNCSNKSIIYIITIILCFTYACTDEIHQLYVIGRTGQFSDVLIDTSGSLIGIAIYYIAGRFKK